MDEALGFSSVRLVPVRVHATAEWVLSMTGFANVLVKFKGRITKQMAGQRNKSSLPSKFHKVLVDDLVLVAAFTRGGLS